MTAAYGGGMPSQDEIIAALALHFDAPKSAAVAWLAALAVHFDARAAQERIVEAGGK